MGDPAAFEILAAEILKNPNITTVRFRNLDVSAGEEKSQAREEIQEKVKRIARKFGLVMLEVHIPLTEDNLHLLRSMVLASECTFLVVGQLKARNSPLIKDARHIWLLLRMLQYASRINPSGGPKTLGFVGTFSTDGDNWLCLKIPEFQTRHKYSQLFRALQNGDLESIRLMLNKLTYKQGVNFAKFLSSGLGRFGPLSSSVSQATISGGPEASIPSFLLFLPNIVAKAAPFMIEASLRNINEVSDSILVMLSNLTYTNTDYIREYLLSQGWAPIRRRRTTEEIVYVRVDII